jgi:hypothetical protein
LVLLLCSLWEGLRLLQAARWVLLLEACKQELVIYLEDAFEAVEGLCSVLYEVHSIAGFTSSTAAALIGWLIQLLEWTEALQQTLWWALVFTEAVC